MKNFGLKLSTIDGSEHLFNAEEKQEIPGAYNYKEFLPDVLDQGSNPICVPCSLSAYLNWKENLNDGDKEDNKIKYFEIYSSKTTEGEGMSFKEAFKFLRHKGVNSKAGKLTINEYAMVKSTYGLKLALVSNGPCVGALPVYNYTEEFWNKSYNDYILGYHAISIVGYDEEGFFIRNSWGDYWGEGGYTYIRNEEFNKFIEIWTIVS